MFSWNRICHSKTYFIPIKTDPFYRPANSANFHRFITNSTSHANSKNINEHSISIENSAIFAVILTSIFITTRNNEAKETQSAEIESLIPLELREKINHFKSLPYWHLAKYLTFFSKLPEECFSNILESIFQDIEEANQIKIGYDVRKIIFDSVSQIHMKDLKDLLLLNFCENILNIFSSEEIIEMRAGLESHYFSEAISSKLHKRFIYNFGLIVKNLEIHTLAIAPSLALEVNNLALREGYQWAKNVSSPYQF